MKLDIPFIDTFLTVCSTGGIANAATHLHISQPAVSHRIKILERQLNVKLFERRGKKLVITEAGKRLKFLSEKYFEELSSIYSDLIEKRESFRETLRIGSVSGFGRYVLFPILCGDEFENVRIHLTYPTAQEIFEQIDKGEYEIGFVYHEKTSNNLLLKPVYNEEIVLIVSSKFKINLKLINEISYYEKLPFITYDESDYVFGKWFDVVFAKQPRSIASSHHFEELEEVVELVAAGKGLSIIPSHSIPAINKKQIKIIRPNKKKCINKIYSVTSQRNKLKKETELIFAKLKLISNK